MITIAVCDDNINYSKELASFLRKICAGSEFEKNLDQTVLEFSCAEDVLLHLKDHPINILFLDIDMPVLNGFNLAERLNKLYPDIIIIFVSSHENFVYSSFEYSPFRFLRKSHIKSELKNALIKAIEKCMISNDILVFKTTDGDITIRAKDILYFEGQKNYFLIHTASTVYKCRGTMGNLEKEMQNRDFFRIHSGFIVNMENIDRITNRKNVWLKNNENITVSQSKISSFKKAYMIFSRKRFTNDINNS